MTRHPFDTAVSADAWDRLVSELKELGPGPLERKVIGVLCDLLWEIEDITLDEDHREAASDER